MPQLYEKEEYVHNQVPMRIYNHVLEKEEIYTPLHWHRSIEIDLALEGRIYLKIDGKNQKLEKGDWAVINSGELHSNTWVEREDSYQGITVLISKSFLDGWLCKDAYFVHTDDPDGESQVRETIEKLGIVGKEKKDFGDLECMISLFALTKLLGQYCLKEKADRDGRGMKGINNVKEIINYIDLHYKESLSLGGVAEQFHYSSAHLSRLFKEHIGYNFYEYLQDVRLMNVMEQLKKSQDVRLIDCAMENGFPNVKSFITTFKKMYDCTPSEWRKNKSGKKES